MPERRTLRSRNALTSQPSPPTPPVSTRSRRGASGSTFKVTRNDSNSPDESRKALRLTVKMPSSKLREAMSNSPVSRDPNPGDQLTGAEVVSGPRSSRAKKSYVVESGSDDEDEDEDVNEDEEVEASEDEQVEQGDEGQDEEDEGEDEDEEDAEGEVEEASADEDDDADGDIDMDEDADDGQPLPAPPTILKVKGPAAVTPAKSAAKPTLTVTPAQDAKVQSVEAKEMEMEDDDEELSELSENEEEDAEGEDDADGDDDVDMEQDDEGRSDAGSRGSTPDVSKMTKRQQGRLNQVVGSDFLQLPMEPQIKKHLSAEEHAMRRAEMARRRKNLSEKRNEEEKMDTINRLLKKQAPKRRGKISAAEISAQDRGDDSASPPEEEVAPANPVFVRWISDASGCRVGVPGEWLSGPAGRIFGGGRAVEEVG